MYFACKGNVLARYTGDWKKNIPEDLPAHVMHYGFDDESLWTGSRLKQEAGLVCETGPEYDADAFAAIAVEMERREGILSVPEFDRWEDLVFCLEQDQNDSEAMAGRRPVIFPDELSLATRKLIRELAKIEHEEVAFRKKHLNDTSDDPDGLGMRECFSLSDRGRDIREALLDSDLGDGIPDGCDPAENMKNIAARLLFLYARTRLTAETEGGLPDEDLFYAGANLYTHAVADRLDQQGRTC